MAVLPVACALYLPASPIRQPLARVRTQTGRLWGDDDNPARAGGTDAGDGRRTTVGSRLGVRVQVGRRARCCRGRRRSGAALQPQWQRHHWWVSRAGRAQRSGRGAASAARRRDRDARRGRAPEFRAAPAAHACPRAELVVGGPHPDLLLRLRPAGPRRPSAAVAELPAASGAARGAGRRRCLTAGPSAAAVHRRRRPPTARGGPPAWSGRRRRQTADLAL
jgi:hypothetical protein